MFSILEQNDEKRKVKLSLFNSLFDSLFVEIYNVHKYRQFNLIRAN